MRAIIMLLSHKKYPSGITEREKMKKSCKKSTGGLDNWEDEVYNNILYHHR
ncbi:hypothetical protein I5Q82_11785 [Acutalibacter muris]|jgi:hypothetical protein|uniref:Uncharacterized protein n=1 Tax=Acutalibacter muris TaxID=1796620 RepID=A0AA92L3I8_9FIRM|nr:hypothetical protein [Acutalibacter muris]MCI9192550.1 hypothetical protein [Acutalibacter muris]MCI9542888.1 hypothetical protein [Acutalibacter muris]QQR28780.1 hypothetical protein I5Q82_11785 [Acutalibacter muris]